MMARYERLKDFHVTVKIKNNQLFERRLKLGLSQPEISERIGINHAVYLKYENLAYSPVKKKDGGLKESAKKIADFFGISPVELWPDEILSIEKNKIEKKFSSLEVTLLVGEHTQMMASSPDKLINRLEIAQKIDDTLDTLNDREREVIERYFGLNGRPESVYEEIGNELMNLGSGEVGVRSERVRQILDKAIRKLRHSSRRIELQHLLSVD